MKKMSQARQIDSGDVIIPQRNRPLIIDFQCDPTEADRIRNGIPGEEWIQVDGLKISVFNGEIPAVLQLDSRIIIKGKQIKFIK